MGGKGRGGEEAAARCWPSHFACGLTELQPSRIVCNNRREIATTVPD